VIGLGITPPPALLYRKSQARQHETGAAYCGGSSPISVSAT
jgi:hypothetical protein